LLKGIIFDIDGTLVDSNDAHAQSWVDTFAEAGYDVPFDAVRPLIGMGADKLLPKTIGIGHDSAEGKKLIKRRSEIFRERYLPRLRPLKGSRELVLRVRSDGLKAIVATSAKDKELKGLLKAIEESDIEPEHLIMIGDTPYDIEAATKARVRTIGFRSGGWTDEGLKGALEIYDGPADLLAHYDSSLIGREAK